jgi:hypothetical protein
MYHVKKHDRMQLYCLLHRGSSINDFESEIDKSSENQERRTIGKIKNVSSQTVILSR